MDDTSVDDDSGDLLTQIFGLILATVIVLVYFFSRSEADKENDSQKSGSQDGLKNNDEESSKVSTPKQSNVSVEKKEDLTKTDGIEEELIPTGDISSQIVCTEDDGKAKCDQGDGTDESQGTIFATDTKNNDENCILIESKDKTVEITKTNEDKSDTTEKKDEKIDENQIKDSKLEEAVKNHLQIEVTESKHEEGEVTEKKDEAMEVTKTKDEINDVKGEEDEKEEVTKTKDEKVQVTNDIKEKTEVTEIKDDKVQETKTKDENMEVAETEDEKVDLTEAKSKKDEEKINEDGTYGLSSELEKTGDKSKSSLSLEKDDNQGRDTKQETNPPLSTKEEETVPVEMPLTTSYTIDVRTGDVSYAGTDANVYIILHGDLCSTSKIFLEKNKSTTHANAFERDHIDTFNVDGPHVGKLTKVTIGHDNHCSFAGWYVGDVAVQNLLHEKKYIFPVERWLDEDKDDGKLEVEVSI